MRSLLATAALGIIAMGTEILGIRRFARPILLVALAGAIAVLVSGWNLNEEVLGGMMLMDNYAIAFSVMMLATAGLLLPLANSYIDRDMVHHQGDVLAVLMFAMAGGVCMTAYTNMVMLFVGLEILSIGFYVLAATRKRDLLSNESAIKYFLLGAFSTGFLLFGITLLYGTAGSFNLLVLRDFASMHAGNLPTLYGAGMLLVAIGLLFKISAVPFHFWAPDVYEGAPTWVTSAMATIVKTASFAAFLRLMLVAFAPAIQDWNSIIMVVAALTLIVGNAMAFIQPGVKRMLAFSSISHAGYLLLTLVGLNIVAAPITLLYLAAYVLSSIIAFAVLIQVIEKHGNDSIASFKGLGKTNPLMAAAFSVAMLSMAGIPPLAGFFAKYLVFMNVVNSGHMGLAVLAVVAAIAGIYYYFKVIIAMYTGSVPAAGGISEPFGTRASVIVAMMGTIVLGILPNLLTDIFKTP